MTRLLDLMNTAQTYETNTVGLVRTVAVRCL